MVLSLEVALLAILTKKKEIVDMVKRRHATIIIIVIHPRLPIMSPIPHRRPDQYGPLFIIRADRPLHPHPLLLILSFLSLIISRISRRQHRSNLRSVYSSAPRQLPILILLRESVRIITIHNPWPFRISRLSKRSSVNSAAPLLRI